MDCVLHFFPVQNIANAEMFKTCPHLHENKFIFVELIVLAQQLWIVNFITKHNFALLVYIFHATYIFYSSKFKYYHTYSMVHTSGDIDKFKFIKC